MHIHKLPTTGLFCTKILFLIVSLTERTGNMGFVWSSFTKLVKIKKEKKQEFFSVDEFALFLFVGPGKEYELHAF